MRLRLPSRLRKIADWDMRLQLVAIAAIFVAGLVLIVFEHCANANDVASSYRGIVDSSTEIFLGADRRLGSQPGPPVRRVQVTVRLRANQLTEAGEKAQEIARFGSTTVPRGSGAPCRQQYDRGAAALLPRKR
jgi:hypothetical protein